MAYFTDVTVTYRNGQVKCEPDPVVLHYNRPQGPDSVRWILDTAQSTDTLAISWKDQNPFNTMQTSANGRQVEGTDNKKVQGDYDYTVTIKDAQGNTVAELDPRLRNDI